MVLRARDAAAAVEPVAVPEHGLQQKDGVTAVGWPRRCQLRHAFLQEYSYKGLKSAQLLDQRCACLTCPARIRSTRAPGISEAPESPSLMAAEPTPGGSA
jgi:hypothetical protein